MQGESHSNELRVHKCIAGIVVRGSARQYKYQGYSVTIYSIVFPLFSYTCAKIPTIPITPFVVCICICDRLELWLKTTTPPSPTAPTTLNFYKGGKLSCLRRLQGSFYVFREGQGNIFFFATIVRDTYLTDGCVMCTYVCVRMRKRVICELSLVDGGCPASDNNGAESM